MLSRRRFVTETVILTLIPVAVGCSDDDDGGGGSCNGAGATSSMADGHTHTVCVASADLMDPPSSGARYTTSSDDGHTHEIELAADQLAEIAGGSSVTVTTTVTESHSHTFMLSESSDDSASNPGGGY